MAMFSKLIFMLLIIATVNSESYVSLTPMANKLMNRIKCIANELIDTIDQVSSQTWLFGDEDHKLPVTEKEILDFLDRFWTTLSSPKLSDPLLNNILNKVPKINLFDKFFGSFNKSSIMEKARTNMDSISKQFKYMNENDYRFKPTKMKYSNVLANAGSLGTELTLGQFACYIKKWTKEAHLLLYVDFYPIAEEFLRPYITLADILGADQQCDWDAIPEAPKDICYKSNDALLIKGLANLLKLKYLNNFHMD